jgi:pteridine reductase
MSLENKTILVTGAAKRIGRTVSLFAASQGADVILHYRSSAQEAESLAEDISKRGRKAFLYQADLAEPDQLHTFADNAFSEHQVDILINNASLFKDLQWSDTNYAEWQNHQMVNLTAPFLLSQAFAFSLPEAKIGRIVNMLDWRALRPGPDHFPYTISKAGLAALTRSLAAALAPRILVNGIALGAILPPSTGNVSSKIVDNLPIARWADLHELEQILTFLLTGPTYITGEILHLDGGRHLI